MQPPHIRGWRKSTNTQQATDIPPALDLPSDIRELLTSATSKVLWQATLIPFEQSRRKAWEPHRITLRAPAAHLSLKIVFSEHCLSQTIIFHANPSPLFTQPGSLLCLLDRTGAGEQDDYLSQGHLVSQGHPSQQWQHDPFSSAIWLGWNKGSPKLLAASLVWTLGCCSWVDFMEGISSAGALIQIQETPESPSGSLSERYRSIWAFSWLSVLWNAQGALCCRTSLLWGELCL